MATPTIMVVDDEPHVRLLYKEELTEDGFDVLMSDGTDDVVGRIGKEKPDVLILDIKLGQGLSGLDILQNIRSQGLELPVILSTAYDSFQHDLKSIAADFYVVKSVDLTELKDRINEAVSMAAQRPS